MSKDELLPKIKPRNIKESDKYSRNLYLWVRYRHTLNVVNHRGELYLTTEDWKEDDWGKLSGARLTRILCKGKTAESCVYINIPVGECRDVTEEFWSEYIKKGRCHLDPDHNGFMMNTESRFSIIDRNHRVCNWCGREFSRHVEKRMACEFVEVWA